MDGQTISIRPNLAEAFVLFVQITNFCPLEVVCRNSKTTSSGKKMYIFNLAL